MVTGLCHYTNSKCVSLLLSLFVHCLNSHFTLESSFISHPFHFLFVLPGMNLYIYNFSFFHDLWGIQFVNDLLRGVALFAPDAGPYAER